jgi:hypothetical protein
VAWITAAAPELRGDAVTAKLAVVVPAWTVTEEGTEAAPLLLESATVALLTGATFSVTAQVELVGAVILETPQIKLVGTGA